LPNGDIMPNGMHYIIDFAAMMRNEKPFPNPTEFNPGRFLDDKIHGKPLILQLGCKHSTQKIVGHLL